MTGEAEHVTEEQFAQLGDLLDQRLEMMQRHQAAKKAPERQQMTLAEKLTADRASKAELAELNGQIEAITGRSDRSR